MERNIDELNLISYEDYFSKMPVSKKQRKDRIRAAQEFEDIFLYFITMLDLETTYGTEQKSIDDFKVQYTEAVKKYNSNDVFIALYVASLAANLLETAIKHKGEEWYTSFNRAQLLAANGANSVLNQTDFDNATSLGYTRKKWLTEMDNKVRPTHIVMEGQTIPINDLFIVGNAVMPYPHYYACNYPEEVVNCRCGIMYIK